MENNNNGYPAPPQYQQPAQPQYQQQYQQPQYANPAYAQPQYQQPQYGQYPSAPQKKVNLTTVLIFSILALVTHFVLRIVGLRGDLSMLEYGIDSENGYFILRFLSELLHGFLFVLAMILMIVFAAGPGRKGKTSPGKAALILLAIEGLLTVVDIPVFFLLARLFKLGYSMNATAIATGVVYIAIPILLFIGAGSLGKRRVNIPLIIAACMMLSYGFLMTAINAATARTDVAYMLISFLVDLFLGLALLFLGIKFRGENA